MLAGQALANQILAAVDPDVTVAWTKKDGDSVKYGDVFCEMRGKAHSILRAERVLLNFMQRMSGIATLTRQMADAAAPATMLETRKTVPGLRLPDKWAAGGRGQEPPHGSIRHDHDQGQPHRRERVDRGGGSERAGVPEGEKSPAKIEVETRTMAEVAQVIALLDDDEADTSAVSRVMLDNMSLEDMAEAVRMFAGRVETEASGNVTLETVHAIGQTGVTFVSSGALTHSVMAPTTSYGVTTRDATDV